MKNFTSYSLKFKTTVTVRIVDEWNVWLMSLGDLPPVVQPKTSPLQRMGQLNSQ